MQKKSIFEFENCTIIIVKKDEKHKLSPRDLRQNYIDLIFERNNYLILYDQMLVQLLKCLFKSKTLKGFKKRLYCDYNATICSDEVYNMLKVDKRFGIITKRMINDQ